MQLIETWSIYKFNKNADIINYVINNIPLFSSTKFFKKIKE